MLIALLVSLHITGEQRENKNGVKQWNQGKSQKKGKLYDSLKELLLQKETIHRKVDAEKKQK